MTTSLERAAWGVRRGDAAGASARACVLTAPGVVELRAVEAPAPGPGQVRVALEGSGVCASNLPLWEGREWFTYPAAPGAPGHEGWGVIDALGDGVRGLRVGQRVAALSYAAYATHDVAAADHVVPLPDALTGRPFPGEPLGCAFNIARRAGIEAGQDVAIVGVGFLGALLCRLAADAGARVIAVSRRPFALDVARQFGAHELVPMDDHWRVIERVKALTAGAMCARTIECVGLQWPLDLAGELTAERGRLVVAGFHQDGPRQVNMFLWNWRGLDVINAHERDPRAYVAGIREAVEAVAAGRLDPDPLYTHRHPLDGLAAAFEATRRRPDGFLKALVTA
ncbi:MDR/zinc-dependent alcohol dehydrogenase-like family protein [Roseisolibacter agri]|uniref:Oxidoreductase n=1 Tax=Roseisolibacter agri TaxID=2014610 RepID=A0AA37Q5U7_9BACT|nr:zinc-binding dehydrogenase [Roseisolibacter agri]GLC24302.1 oxidoreductase [Roseisolibacter agri]